MESAINQTSFHDSKYHSKRLRDLLLQKHYQKPTASIHVIKSLADFEMSLEAKFDSDDKVAAILLK